MKRQTWFGIASLALVGLLAAGCDASTSSGATAPAVPAGDPATTATATMTVTTTTTLVGAGHPTGEPTPGTETLYSNSWGDDWFWFGLSRGTGGNLGPRALAVRDNGETYVLDTVKKRVMVFRPDGTILRTFHADTERATGIAVTSDGYVALNNADTDRSVTVYGPEGDLAAEVTVPDDLVVEGIRAHGTQVWAGGRIERSHDDGLPSEYVMIWDGGGIASRRTRSPRLPSGAGGAAVDVGYDASGRLVYEFESGGAVASGALPGGEGHGVVDWGVDDRGDLVIAAERTGSASPGWDVWKAGPQGDVLGPQRVDGSRWAETIKPLAVTVDGSLHLLSSRDDGATVLRVRVAWSDRPGPLRPLTYGSGINFSPVVDGDWSAWLSRERDLLQVYACRLPSGDPFPAGPPSVDIAGLQLSEGRIAWQASESQGRQIHVYDTATGGTRKLTEGPADHRVLHLSGDLIVWSETPRGGTNARLVLQDLVTGGLTELTGSLFDGAHISGDHVAWSEDPPTSTGATRVFLYDRATRETTQITTGGFSAYDPRVADGLVAWRANPPSAPQNEVYAYSVATGSSARLTQDRCEKTEVTTGGGLVAWIAREDDHSVIYAWTEADRLTTTIADDSSSKGSLQLAGDWIAWESHGDADRAAVYLYHRPSGVTVRVSPPPRAFNAADSTQPRLAVGRLIFATGSNVMLYTFAADRAPDPLP